MHKANLLPLARKVVLDRFPMLDGITTFDIEFESVSKMHCCFLLIVRLDGHAAWSTLQDRYKCTGRGTDYKTIDSLLDYYRGNDVDFDFELDGMQWLLGDGDDTGAVTERDSHTASIWVRSFF